MSSPKSNCSSTCFSILLISFSITLLLSCYSTQREIVGTWERSKDRESSVITFNSDGTFTAQITNNLPFGSLEKEGNISGTWNLRDNRLITKILQSDNDSIRVGYTSSDEIVEICSFYLTLRTQENRTQQFKMIK